MWLLHVLVIVVLVAVDVLDVHVDVEVLLPPPHFGKQVSSSVDTCRKRRTRPYGVILPSSDEQRQRLLTEYYEWEAKLDAEENESLRQREVARQREAGR